MDIDPAYLTVFPCQSVDVENLLESDTISCGHFTVGSRSQTRDQDHRSVRRSSPNLVSDPIGRGPIAVRDRDVGSGLRERESVSAPRDRERMSRALRSVPDPDETRPDGNTPADNQVVRNTLIHTFGRTSENRSTAVK